MVRDIYNEEVKNALFNISGLKAPGFDGFSALFFQNHWELLFAEITNMVKLAFCFGKVPCGLNHPL